MRYLILAMTVLVTALLLGIGCEVTEETLKEDERIDAGLTAENTPTESPEDTVEKTCAELPIVKAPVNFDMTFSGNNKGTQVYWSFHQRGDTYWYDAYQAMDDFHALFSYNLNDNQAYQALLQDETGTFYDAHTMPDFYETYMAIWGFDPEGPRDHVTLSPMPLLPDACWQVQSDEDPDFISFYMDDPTYPLMDCNMKLDRHTGMIKTATILMDDYQLFISRPDYYVDQLIPFLEVPKNLTTLDQTEGYEFLIIRVTPQIMDLED